MSLSNIVKLSALSIGISAGAAGAGAAEEGAAPEPSAVEKALAGVKPLLFSRVRYEHVSQDGIAENADALTYLVRAGVETGPLFDTSLLVEFDHVQDLVGDFNSTINGKTQFPVVPDPTATELNRLQLTNTTLPDTKVTLGRQRIILDDARFVGNVGWRQNEQTFDAVRVENASVKGLKLDVAYIDQVNRIFGDDSPVGRFESDSFIVNGEYDVPLKGAKLSVSGFAYLLDFENAPAASSQTFGAAVDASKGPFTLKGAYAAQSDYGAQPLSYDADYYLIEGVAAKNGFSLGAGYEVLTGDGSIGFATPLATLHAFNGWADVFLTTPANGLEDIYVTAGWKRKDVGPFSLVSLGAVYHDFSAENASTDYGSEFDVVGAMKFSKLTLLAKFSTYDADAFATDRNKLWLQIEVGL